MPIELIKTYTILSDTIEKLPTVRQCDKKGSKFTQGLDIY